MNSKRTLCLCVGVILVTVAATANSLAEGVIDLSPYSRTGFVLGDVNGDGGVRSDINTFAFMLVDPEDYLEIYDYVNPRAGDTNQDCKIDNSDISTYVDIFAGFYEPPDPLELDCPVLPLGDANGDGKVNNGDIEAWILAMVNLRLWTETYTPRVPPEILDINQDGLFNPADRNPFHDLLVSGANRHFAASSAEVPEPATTALAVAEPMSHTVSVSRSNIEPAPMQLLFTSEGEGSYPTSILPSTLLLGDANGDGVVNNGDIGPFSLALVDFIGWSEIYSSTVDPAVLDTSEDGNFNGGDINPFVEILVSGSSQSFTVSAIAIPEPSAWALVFTCFVATAAGGRRSKERSL